MGRVSSPVDIILEQLEQHLRILWGEASVIALADGRLVVAVRGGPLVAVTVAEARLEVAP